MTSFRTTRAPNTIYFYEVYRDEAALAAHRAAPQYPAWGNLPADWFIGQKAVVIRGEPSVTSCKLAGLERWARPLPSTCGDAEQRSRATEEKVEIEMNAVPE